MNYSSIRKRKLVSSRDSAKRDHEVASGSEELAAKLECYTPVISGKGKKAAQGMGLRKTKNGTFLMQLSEEPNCGFGNKHSLAEGHGFKKLEDRPDSKKETRRTSGILKTCFLPNACRPHTSKGTRKKSGYFESPMHTKRTT